MSAGDIRTRPRRGDANEAGNQQLTPKRIVEGPLLDKRLAVACSWREDRCKQTDLAPRYRSEASAFRFPQLPPRRPLSRDLNIAVA
jgi:hypothetical protein